MDHLRIQRHALAAGGGLVACGAALGVAELVSAAVRPEAAPVIAVGGALIDLAPSGVKEWAVERFGTSDKLVLKQGILAVLALLALLLGVLAPRYRRSAAAGVLVIGAAG
ncbi:hypothetical protein NKH77_04815 [Streptomyces sp. M19]